MGLSNDLSSEAGSFSYCRPNPHGCFHSEVSGLISLRWSSGLCSLLRSPPFIPVYLCANVGSHGLLVFGLPAPIRPTLRQSRSRHGHTSPLRPGCLSPPLLPVWMNVYFLSPWCRTSLPFDFLSVLVVRGGVVCLPTPPSWFTQISNSFFYFLFF